VGSNPTPSVPPARFRSAAPGAVSTLGSRRVIPPEQLTGALERLDPRERELLALSLRRRVPDEALARVYDVVPQEVARRRAAAIERLADELGAQRGEDLGAVLQALLDEGSWSAAEGSDNGEAQLEREPEAEAESEEEPDAEAAPVLVEAEAPVVPVSSEPVLEMLAAREDVRGPDSDAAADGPGVRRGVLVAVALGSFAAAVIGGAAAFVGLSEWGDDGGSSSAAPPSGGPGEGTKHFIPQLGGPFEAPFPSEPQPITCFSIAAVNGETTLYRKPGEDVRIRLSARTEWNSPRILGVVRRRGDWISVQAPELGNGEVAWMRAHRARIDCVRWSLHADLSRRRLSVERDGKTVRRFEIAIGRKGNPTPRGRFSVTDKLRVTDPASPYGCCVLALTGHQTRLPASWPGGDRLAVHATKELSSLGKPASLGCLRVTSSQARWLIRTIPLGAPLFVRA
jgi:L,D-transpeptidase catalytic domain